MQEHKLTVPKTAHYYTIGRPSKKIKQLWIATHGYGQLAKKFIYKFEGLDDGETLVIAPDALSRFYFGGFTGTVGSSWMTREDRLDEIDDYANYLQTIYDMFVPQLAEDVEIVLFGFSQGVATQCRWIMQKFPRFDHLIMWAGFMPEDLDYRPHLDLFNSKNLHFIYGTEDEFLTPERLDWYNGMVGEQGVKMKTTIFEGKHRVDRALLHKIKNELVLV